MLPNISILVQMMGARGGGLGRLQVDSRVMVWLDAGSDSQRVCIPYLSPTGNQAETIVYSVALLVDLPKPRIPEVKYTLRKALFVEEQEIGSSCKMFLVGLKFNN